MFLPFDDRLLGGDFGMVLGEARGMGYDGGDGPATVETTPWTSAGTIQRVELKQALHCTLT